MSLWSNCDIITTFEEKIRIDKHSPDSLGAVPLIAFGLIVVVVVGVDVVVEDADRTLTGNKVTFFDSDLGSSAEGLILGT